MSYPQSGHVKIILHGHAWLRAHVYYLHNCSSELPTIIEWEHDSENYQDRQYQIPW